MNRIVAITSALAFLVFMPSCGPGPGPSDLSDLELEAVTLMSGPGISTSAMQIEQGVRANVSAMVFVNNHATADGQDTFDRNNVIVELSLWNTAPDQKDETGGLEEYHARIIYGEGIGWVSKELGPVMSITVTDDQTGDLAVLSPVATKPLTFPPDLTQSQQYLSDQLAFVRDNSYLAEMGFASLAAKIRNDHIPRARYVQDQVNNHYDADPVYQLVYQDALGSIAATHLIFTFEIATQQLRRGQWEMRVEVDPDDLIEEPTQANNASAIIDLELIEPFGDMGDWEMGNTAPEEWYVASCDLVIGQPDDYGPPLLRATYKRLDDDEGAWRFWEANHVLETNQNRMRASEFWGPRGSGEYLDGGSYRRYYTCAHDESGCTAGDTCPAPDEIENVIILAAGYAQCNDINIVTGQPGCHQVDGYADGCGGGDRDFCDDGGQFELLYTSIAARIILNEPSYTPLYSSRNTLLTLIEQHEYDMALCGGDWVGCDEDAYAQIRDAWIDYIRDRTDDLRNVRTIILSGQSRGGVFSIALADHLKRYLLAGTIARDNPNPIRIVVATNAAANTESDEGLGGYHNWSLGGSGWGDNAHCHNLESIWTATSSGGAADIYPLYMKQLVDDGIIDKPFIHTGDCEAGDRQGRPEFHDQRIGSLNGHSDAIQNFYTQVFTNMGHTAIRVEYREENGPEQLRYIYDKAWSTDTDSVRFFDFDMVERYGFAEETCD